MGVYRWYLIFPLIVYSALSYSASRPQIINAIPPSFLMSRSATDADLVCSHKPVINDTFEPYYLHGGNYYVNYKGCIYIAIGLVVAPDNTDYAASNWSPVKALPPDIPMTESHIRQPDSGDDSDGNSGGDSTPPTEPDNPDITPPVNPPVKPPVNPDSSSVSQLYQQYNNCSIQLSHFPMPDYSDYNPSIDYQYNAQVRQCNSVLDRLTSMINSGFVNGGTDDNHDFITGDGIGNFYKCKRNPYTPQEWADMGKLYPGPVLGNQLVKKTERQIGTNCRIEDGKTKCDFNLNFHYDVDNGRGTSVCNSVYSSHLSSGDSDSGSQGDGNGDDTGHGDSGSSDGDTGTGDQGGADVSLPSLDVPDLTLSPLWNIWPSARDFKLTLPAAKCPVFNIEVFGTNHQIDTFCTIFTPDIIAIIRAISILTASIIAFIIVLRS